jgi:hypothetical protein
MNYLNQNSLGSTLDSLSESLFFKQPIPKAQAVAVAQWIASRQGLPGSYAGMFAPTEKDTLGIHLFTGEAIRSQAGIAHILGEESCRVLVLLGVKAPMVANALSGAVSRLAARIKESEKDGNSPGFYCCGTCSAAYWRNLAIGLLPRARERLRAGLKELKQLRSGNGKWRRFPFFYTCLALTEIGPELAQREMQYAASYWQANLKKFTGGESVIARRRAAVGRRLLELCER